MIENKDNVPVETVALSLWDGALTTKSGQPVAKFIDKKSYIARFLADPANIGKTKADAARAHFADKTPFMKNLTGSVNALVGAGELLATKATRTKSGIINVSYIDPKSLKAPGEGKMKAPKAETLEELAAKIANLTGKPAVEILASLRSSNPKSEADAIANEIKSQEPVNA